MGSVVTDTGMTERGKTQWNRVLRVLIIAIAALVGTAVTIGILIWIAESTGISEDVRAGSDSIACELADALSALFVFGSVTIAAS